MGFLCLTENFQIFSQLFTLHNSYLHPLSAEIKTRGIWCGLVWSEVSCFPQCLCVWCSIWSRSLEVQGDVGAQCCLDKLQTSQKGTQEVAGLSGILLVRMGWRLISQIYAEIEFVNIHELELTVLSKQTAAEIQ